MGGLWLKSTTLDDDTTKISNTANSQLSVFDVPRSNFLGKIAFQMRNSGSAGVAGAWDVDRVQLVASGGLMLMDLGGGSLDVNGGNMLWGIHKFEQGSLPTGRGASGSFPTVDLPITFGRVPHDETVILPAKVFRSLQLRVTHQTNTAGTTYAATMVTDEYISNDDPKEKLILKRAVFHDEAAGNSKTIRARLPLGNRLRKIYIFNETTDANLNGAPIVVKTNNSERSFEIPRRILEEDNIETYRFDDAAVPTFGTTHKMYCLDYDLLEDLIRTVPTDRLNELTIEVKGGSSATSGNVVFIAEELLPVV